MDSGVEAALRQEIMQWLDARVAESGGVVTRAELMNCDVRGRRLPLVDRNRGIRNPVDFEATLSIMSSDDGPYHDRFTEGDLLRYAYRAGDPDGSDNRKLRRAMALGTPLIMFRRLEPNLYLPSYPVYVVGDERANREFVVALDEAFRFVADPLDLTEDQRRYARRIHRQRLHQPEFRARVIHAYETRCAVCALRHGSLLDASHIDADSEPDGAPVVSNGLALCKIHHAAYDQDLLGITPDYQVRIATGLLEEIDGPMLRHGLQEMQGRALLVPRPRRQRPDRERLARRYEQFTRAA